MNHFKLLKIEKLKCSENWNKKINAYKNQYYDNYKFIQNLYNNKIDYNLNLYLNNYNNKNNPIVDSKDKPNLIAQTKKWNKVKV